MVLEPYFEVCATADPNYAIQLIEKGSYDIILTDFRMPVVTGLDILQRVNDVQPRTPVLVITGETADQDIQSLLEQGAKAILRKPFKKKGELLQEVKKFL